MKLNYPITITALLMALALAGCGGSNASSAEKLPSNPEAKTALSNYVTSTNQVGSAAALVNGNRLVWAGATGKANVATNTDAAVNTVFMAGSISKTIVATAAMKLVEAGRLDLDQNINSYLPFEVKNPSFPSVPITMRQLLAHTGGISDAHLATYFVAKTFYYNDQDPPLSLAAMMEGFFKLGGANYDAATFKTGSPGTEYEYTNIGYALAGYVIERIAGKSFATYTKEVIFRPLGMTKTSWRLSDYKTSELAMPYDDARVATSHYTFADYPDGGVRTTVLDLSKFLRAFTGGGSFGGVRILKETSVAELQRVQYPNVPGAENQALGYDYRDLGKGYIGHLGEETGVAAAMYVDPASKSGAIVLFNTGLSAQAESLPGLLGQLFDIASRG